MHGSIRISGGHESGIAGNSATAAETGSPPARSAAKGSEQQPPGGPTGPRVAPAGRLAPRGPASPGGDAAAVTVPPALQLMECHGAGSQGAAASMQRRSPLQLHAAQQLILAGDIKGSEAACRAEADHRVKLLLDKLQSLPGGTVHWPEAVAELENMQSVSSGTTVSENTYYQLVDAAKRAVEKAVATSGRAGTAPPAFSNNPAFDAEAVARLMGWPGV